MKAMVWAAGLGTRLRPLTEARPKAMVPVGHVSMLEHTLRSCHRAGIVEVIVNTHYFPETVVGAFGDGARLGLKITYSYEEELLENAGALVKVRDFFDGEPFLAIASDNLTDLDLNALVNFHQEHHALATIATSTAEDVTRYGIIATGAHEAITSFQEKPKQEDALGDQIATCIYAFSPGIWDYLPQTPKSCHFGKEVFPVLLEKKLPLFAYRYNGYWNDVGNPGNYLLANFDALSGKFKVSFDGFEKVAPDVLVGEGSTISPQAELSGPVLIGKHVTVADHAVIGPEVVIGDNSSIGEGARISRSVLWESCEIMKSAQVTDSVLAQQTKIHPQVTLANAVMGAASQLNHTFFL